MVGKILKIKVNFKIIFRICGIMFGIVYVNKMFLVMFWCNGYMKQRDDII